MVSVNMRGWTFIEEANAPDPDSPRWAAVEARASALMQEWSTIHHEEEQESYRDRDDSYFENEYDPRNCECDEGRDTDPDELCVHDRKALQFVEAQEKVKNEGRRVRKQLIIAELEALNVRPMRPYEHHNEDEAYYQYMEEGRFGHYSE